MKTRRAPWKEVAGWCLFDFAVTALMANGGLYFPSYVVVDLGVPDLWFNVTFAASTVFVLVAGPFAGMLADQTNRPKTFLAFASAGLVALTVSLSFIDGAAPPLRQAGALVSLFGILTLFQFAMIYYGGIFARAFDPAARRSISGLGIGASWSGAIAGLLIVLPFVSGAVPGIEAGRQSAFVPAAAIFLVLGSLGIALMPSGKLDSPPRHEAQSLRPLMSALRHNRVLIWFLLGYVLLMDAVLTIQNNLPVFLTRVLGAGDQTQAMLFLTLFTAAAGGGLLSIPLLRNLTPRQLLAPLSVLWGGVIIGIAVAGSIAPVFGWFGAAGILLGVTLSACRLQLAALAPPPSANSYFGVYNAFERLASVLGPLAWGLTVSATSPVELSYRLAMGTMVAFVIAAFVAFVLLARTQPLHNA